MRVQLRAQGLHWLIAVRKSIGGRVFRSQTACTLICQYLFAE